MVTVRSCACGKVFPLADAHRGMAARCPACDAWVDAPAEGEGAVSSGDEPHAPGGEASASSCPACHKPLSSTALRCCHCGHFVGAAQGAPVRHGMRTSVLALIALACGVLSFVFPVNILAMVMSCVAMVMISRKPRELDGLWIAQFAFFLGIVGTAYWLYGLLLPQ